MSVFENFKARQSRRITLFLCDTLVFCAVAAVCYLIASIFDTALSVAPKTFLVNTALLYGATVLSRSVFRIYSNVWRYPNTSAYLCILISDFVGCVVAILATNLTNTYSGVWLMAVISVITAAVVLISRFAYRIYYKEINRISDSDIHKIPVAIVGAGRVGALLAEELLINEQSNYKPVFFIDKDPAKAGSNVAGLKVYPANDAIIPFLKSQAVSEIIIAIVGLENEEAEKLYRFYSQTNCKVKIYDTPVRDISAEKPRVNRLTIREFQIEDLLFRKPIEVENSIAAGYYADKVVLVTGGGGSIGSELCRQIAKSKPKQLVILDIYENNAYEIQQELIRLYGNTLNLQVVIASVRDRTRMEAVFKTYRPNVVFHAAAHKHVPLMENNGSEAIKNNVFGTYNTADMAEKYGAEKFILISTDKAVNPTNIMGASKRMCEMVIQCREDSDTCFAAVRFGNVLGSNGSVIPLFRKQIESGGPVTITDKRIIRYFMTIPEASQLVMQAGAMAKRGELFVLDMGKPVHIYDLALNMIRLYGLEPYKDIEIREIGLRPGEKLYEELLMKTEDLDRTENKMIFIEKDKPLTREEVESKLHLLSRALDEAAADVNSPKIKRAMRRVVPTFLDPNEVNKTAENSDEMKLTKV